MCRAAVGFGLLMFDPVCFHAQAPGLDHPRRPPSPTLLNTAADEARAADGLIRLEPPRPVRPSKWPRLAVPDPIANRLARQALDEAWTQLSQPACAGLLTEFTDRAGLSLEQRLQSLSVDPQTYLTVVLFIDGSRENACRAGVFAATAPGSRVVRLCIDEVKRTALLDRRHLAVAFIHEALHTLGLGENPPSSSAITRRVRAACHPEWRP